MTKDYDIADSLADDIRTALYDEDIIISSDQDKAFDIIYDILKESNYVG